MMFDVGDVVTLSDDSSCELPEVNLSGGGAAPAAVKASYKSDQDKAYGCIDLTEEQIPYQKDLPQHSSTERECARHENVTRLRVSVEQSYINPSIKNKGIGKKTKVVKNGARSPSPRAGSMRDTDYSNHQNEAGDGWSWQPEPMRIKDPDDLDAMFDDMLVRSASDGSQDTASGKSETQSMTSASSASQATVSGSSGSLAAMSGVITEKTAGARGKRKGQEHAETVKEKSADKLERESKKRRLEEARVARREHMQLQKVFRPGECMKHMTVEVHPTLLNEWYMGDVAREVEALQARVAPAPSLARTDLVLFRRGVPDAADPQENSRALLVVAAERAADLVAQRALAAEARVAAALSGATLTVVVFGMKDYFKKAKRRKDSAAIITEIELEMALTDLLVSVNADTAQLDSPAQLALLIAHYTKAVAEQPYKKAKAACDELTDFYVRGDNRRSVAVDKEGRGLGQVWQQMLTVLPKSSLEIARCVCAEYASPLQLYAECGAHGSSRVSRLGVVRAAGPGACARNLGPEWARRLATLLTADDGSTLLA